MSDILVAKRYARALFKVCGENESTLNEAQKALDSVSELFSDDSIGSVLISPNMPKDLKLQILLHVVAQITSSAVIENFVRVAIDAGRVEVFAGLNQVFEQLLNDSRGIVNATVSSVVALTEEEKTEIKSNLESLIGKKVRLTADLDPELLGGLVVKIGNRIIDLSLKSRLNRVARSAIV